MNMQKDPTGATCPLQETTGDCLYGRSLAMVYSPCQTFDGLYTPEVGLAHGTVFMELDKPFYGARRVKQ